MGVRGRGDVVLADAEGAADRPGDDVPDRAGDAEEKDGDSIATHRTHFFGSKTLSAKRTAHDFNSVSDEVLAHLESMDGAEVRITLEIEATPPRGSTRGVSAPSPRTRGP